MPVVLSPEAAWDIEEIGDYIHARNPRAALRFISELRLRLAKISDAPRGGARRPELWEGLRSIPFHRYVIFYSVTSSDDVRIERVLHGSRDIDTLLGGHGEES